MSLLCLKCGKFGHTKNACTSHSSSSENSNATRTAMEPQAPMEEYPNMEGTKPMEDSLDGPWKVVQRSRKQQKPRQISKQIETKSRYAILEQEKVEGEKNQEALVEITNIAPTFRNGQGSNSRAKKNAAKKTNKKAQWVQKGQVKEVKINEDNSKETHLRDNTEVENGNNKWGFSKGMENIDLSMEYTKFKSVMKSYSRPRGNGQQVQHEEAQVSISEAVKNKPPDLELEKVANQNDKMDLTHYERGPSIKLSQNVLNEEMVDRMIEEDNPPPTRRERDATRDLMDWKHDSDAS